MSSQTKIEVRSLHFFGHHGVSAEEQTLGRPFEADIEAIVNETAHESDSINDTVNYVELAQVLVQLSDKKRFRTLEALLHEFTSCAMEEFPMIQSLTVTLRKQAPPTGLLVGSVGVSVTVTRS